VVSEKPSRGLIEAELTPWAEGIFADKAAEAKAGTRSLITLLLGLGASSMAVAASYRWDPNAGTGFSDPNNWIRIDPPPSMRGVAVPGGVDDVAIPAGTTLSLDSSAAVRILSISGTLSGPGGDLTANSAEGDFLLTSQAKLSILASSDIGARLEGGSELDALSDLAGGFNVIASTLSVKGNFSKVLSVLNAGRATVSTKVTLELNSVVDGIGSSLTVGGTLALANGTLSVTAGGTVTSSLSDLTPRRFYQKFLKTAVSAEVYNSSYGPALREHRP
jgi:hypothetical protein